MTSPPTGAQSPAVISSYYSTRLAEHGDTAAGAGWPNDADRAKRFDIMAGLAGSDLSQARLCDMACGTGAFLEHLQIKGIAPLAYFGLDICPDAIARAIAKFPEAWFAQCDVLQSAQPILPQSVDYTVINGLFTVKASLSDDQMWDFMTGVVERLWPETTKALAFNVMSSVVDWTRDDLFHVPMDKLAAWAFSLAGRRVILRNDYDLFEYTVYMYRDPVETRAQGPA